MGFCDDDKIMVLPVLLFGWPRPMPHLAEDRAEKAPEARDAERGAVVRMWLARLLVQIAEAALFAYLLIWFLSVDPSFTDNLLYLLLEDPRR